MKKVMLAVLIVFVMVSTCIAEGKSDWARDWDTTDTIGQVLTTGVMIADWGQTAYGSRHPKKYEETNAILGKHPHTDSVHAYFTSCIIAHALVSYALPKKIDVWGIPIPTRQIWQAVWIGIEADHVQNNYRIGVQFKF